MAEATYTKVYKDFRGVDFSSERSECDPRRFKDLVNMWKDYRSESGAAVETAPGFRTLLEGSGSRVNGLHFIPTADTNDVGKLIIHRGDGLSVCTLERKDEKDDDGNIAKRGVSASKDDNGNVVLKGIAVANNRTQSVLFHDRLFVVDGQKYFCLYEEDGTIKHAFCSDQAYVPTTFLNGEAYEQRNLLTDKFVEKYDFFSTEGRRHYLKEPVRSNTTDLYALIHGCKVYYKETSPEINFYVSCSLEELGMVTPPTLYIGGEVRDIAYGIKAFPDDYKPAAGTLQTYKSDGTEYLQKTVKCCRGEDDKYYILREGQGSAWWIAEDGYVTELIISGTALGSGTIEIHGTAESGKFAKVGDFQDVFSGIKDFSGFTGTTEAAINGCTLITEYDGRVFLSGNPKLPNTVFYTQRDAVTGQNNLFYIGCYNYLNDGTGQTPITAMMTTPTQLIVLKDHVAQGASNYYHYGADNPAESKTTRNLQPRIYPRENGVPGVGCLGLACNFLDDPVFLSPNGLEAIGKSQVNLERSLTHRSSYVDARLLNENLRGAVAAEWEGYLALLVPGGKLYLADGRQRYEHSLGGYQYEWYYWDGIGVYSGQKDRYHYLTQAPEVPEGVEVPEEIGNLKTAYKTIRDYVDDDTTLGEVKLTYTDPEDEKQTITFHYVVEADSAGQNDAYLVDTDGEQTGGEFQEATALLAVDGCLLFGCADGSICVFNTDRRGEDHYIPPEDYTRCGRRYTARCVTISDTCGRTNLAKSTIRNSLVLKTKAFPYAKVRVGVRTDVDSWETCDTVNAGTFDPAHIDFSALTFNTYDESVAVVRERKKRWLEKQLCFEAECYESPVGIISATFDFKVAGKVKMR